MDIDKKKACIVNASWGSWYPRGTDRLHNSLINTGWSYDIVCFKNEIINEFFDISQPYTIKLAAIKEVIKRGYKYVIWLDSSVFALRNPNHIMDIVVKEGSYFVKTGFNMAQCSADTDLQFAEWTRDFAESVSEVCGGIFGINLLCSKTEALLDNYFKAKDHGVFATPRTHSNMSNDDRFLHARQCQTALSIARVKSGFEKTYNLGDHFTYQNNNSISSIKSNFALRGL